MKSVFAVILFLVTSSSFAAVSTADWMSELQSKISNVPLNEVIMPGSHDSAAYQLENTFSKGPDATNHLNILKFIGVGYAVAAVAKQWTKTQDQDIYQQLTNGVRYLDLRVTYRDEKHEFYLAHALYGPSLTAVLKQIKQFTDEHPRELVIIQIGDLNYMGDDEIVNHKRLVEEFTQTFKSKLAQRNELSPSSTVKDYWAKNRQIVLIHKREKIVQQYSQLFFKGNSIIDYWPNKQDASSLKVAIDQKMEKRKNNSNGNKFHVVQSQMTASKSNYLKGLIPIGPHYKSLKDMAAAVEKQLPTWLKDWKGKNPNIILLDFVNAKTSRQIFELN